MRYQIKVKSTKYRKASRSGLRLMWFGLEKDRFGSYTGSVSSRKKLEKLRDYCEKKRLFFRIDNEYGKRGGSYRSIFFRTHRPAVGNCYFCAYCGKLLPENKITVDHLYPVGSAYKDPDMQKWLKKHHISGINDPENLVAACRRCNQEKGKKTGDWIRKGKRGRRQWVWMLRWIFRFAAAAAVCGAAVYLARAAGIL